jgi:outer membrane murein-binding lipoprotein Lpp
VAHLRAEHRRELLEHTVREPDELARELAPASSWAEPDELAFAQLVSQLTQAGQVFRAHGDRLLSQLAPLSAQVDAFARSMQGAGERVARWAAEHEHELAAERERQGVGGG